MPLNYSKWDNIELSDDSDVEVHPNVDKKSFIRWKQRDIHEKREQRKVLLDNLKAEQKTNDALRPRIQDLKEGLRISGAPSFKAEHERLTAQRAANGNKDSGPNNGPSIDDLVLKLLGIINDTPSVKAAAAAAPSAPAEDSGPSSAASTSSPTDELTKALAAQVDANLAKLDARQADIKKQLQTMEEEDKRKITTDGIKEGWSSGHISKAEPEPEPEVVKPKAKAKPASKETVTTIETLNSPAAGGSKDAGKSSATGAEEDDDDDEELPELTPTLNAWIDLPTVLPNFPLTQTALPPSYNPAKSLNPAPFEVALKFLASHKQLITRRVATDDGDDQDPTDACLFEAFQAQMAGKAERARKCVEKGLMLQYCRKLGPDGVNLFFRKIMGGEPKAAVLYINDVLSTYTRIVERAAALSTKHSSGDVEQIQLVPEDENTTISFSVPSKPPPVEELKVELPTEEELKEANERARAEGRQEMPALTIADVHEMLMRRWEIFEGFSADLQAALKTEKLDEVNKVLGSMNVTEAEEAVRLMDEANILEFGSGADGDVIVDQTGK
ncbi:hsp90 co-chaperone Cdc37 [Tilletia horrida]|nr:hsp90 co-chaperone Cdc37 [Tilletia horrida]KAK0563793.1 hsp90 co-chaperone Cdc37 [Tilletia horrida]